MGDSICLGIIFKENKLIDLCQVRVEFNGEKSSKLNNVRMCVMRVIYVIMTQLGRDLIVAQFLYDFWHNK